MRVNAMKKIAFVLFAAVLTVSAITIMPVKADTSRIWVVDANSTTE